MKLPVLHYSLVVAGVLGGGISVIAPSMSHGQTGNDNPSSIPTPSNG